MLNDKMLHIRLTLANHSKIFIYLFLGANYSRSTIEAPADIGCMALLCFQAAMVVQAVGVAV